LWSALSTKNKTKTKLTVKRIKMILQNINVFKDFNRTLSKINHRRKVKFPFKRNVLPCREDEPGSEKIALK